MMFKPYKKLRFKYIGFIVIIAVLVLIPIVLWKNYERKFALSVVPDALMVNTVIYQEEKSWRIGSGGHHAGIRFYSLPEDAAQKVIVGGIKYLEQLPPNQELQARRLPVHYEQWWETPIEGSPVNQKTGLFDVIDYICMPEFCIDIEPNRLKQINEIISKPGSFYARGQIGIIVVSPKERLVVYFYNRW